MLVLRESKNVHVLGNLESDVCVCVCTSNYLSRPAKMEDGDLAVCAYVLCWSYI